jgi:Intracellular proteinase inhibitor
LCSDVLHVITLSDTSAINLHLRVEKHMNSRIYGVLVAVSLFSCGPDMNVSSAEQSLDTEVAESELSANSAAKWFPRDTNTGFVFERVGAEGTRDVRLQVGSAAQLSGLFENAVTLTESSKTVLSARFGTEAATAFLRFSGASSWTFGSGACGTFVVNRINDSEPLYTGAGVFGERRTFRFTLKTDPRVRCAAPAVSELSFAANVGLVSFKTGRGELFVRKSSSSGIVLGGGNALSTTVTLDKVQYANKPNSIRCIQAPCPSNAEVDVAKVTITLKNNGQTPVPFTYTNGCFVNAVVVNADGLVMRNENTVRFCAAVAGRFTLAPGQVQIFNQEVPMQDLSGNPFEGGYSLYAIVGSDNVGNIIGSAVLNVGTR